MKIDRRRLLKGSLAVPIVLTVRPASATGVTSATACRGRCEVRERERRPAKMSRAMHNDEWMRVELDVYRVAKSWRDEPYHGKFFLGFDKQTFWRLDDRNPERWPAQPTHYHKGAVHSEKTGERMHAIAYLDRDGKVVGFAWENHHHGTPVTLSCYTSAVGLKHKT